MARLLRIEYPGAWYHLTSRGNERKAIFRNDRDRQHFVELLPALAERFHCRLYAYVLMPNHYHLLLETLEANVSRAMQWLNVSYSAWFNRRYDRSGHLFQGRFNAVIVDPNGWALALSRYIHLNPVRMKEFGLDKEARACDRLGIEGESPPELIQKRLQHIREYQWSSYRAYIGLEKSPEWMDCQRVLGLGGGSRAEWRRQYEKQCQQQVRQGLEEAPWKQLTARLVLGDTDFLEEVLEREKDVTPMLKNAVAKRPDWATIVRAVESLKGEKWSKFQARYGDWGRDLALYLGRESGGLTLRELGERIGSQNPKGIGMAVARFAKKLAEDMLMKKKVAKIQNQLWNVES